MKGNRKGKMSLNRLSYTYYIFLFLIFSQFSLLKAEEDKLNSSQEISSIKIGTSLPLSSLTNSHFGYAVKEGIETYFSKINANGGINGRKLELIVLDDGFEPEKAAQNVHLMIEKEKVFGFLSNVGNQNNLVVIPIVNREKVPLFGAFGLFDNLLDRYVFIGPPSAINRMDKMIKELIASGIKPEEMAFYTQNDSLGDLFYNDSMAVLKSIGYKNPEELPSGRYPRNTLNVEGGLATILRQARDRKRTIKVIITGLVGVEATGKFIKLGHQYLPDAFFLVAGSPDLINFDVKNVPIIIYLHVPFFDSSLPGLIEYKNDLKKYSPDAQPSISSFEAYIFSQLFVMGLQKAQENNNFTREGFIDAIESMRDVDIGIGFKFSFSKDQHTILNNAGWYASYRDGEYVQIKLSELKSLITPQ